MTAHEVPAGDGLPADVPYRVIEELGRGATAVVYRAAHVTHGGEAAVKVFRGGAGPEQRERFAAECALQWQLSEHPNVVRLLHASTLDAPSPWTVMDLYELSLDDVLRAAVRPDDATLHRWGLDLVRGLAAVHGQGRLHRDVKPSNVLVRHGVAALSDFGSALVMSDTDGGDLAGTPRYLAPELRAGGSATRRSDVYSAGVTLRRLWSGCLSPEVEGLLDRATSYDPADRPRDAVALLAEAEEALEPFRRSAFVAGLQPGPAAVAAPGVPLPAPRRSRRTAAAVATVVVLGLGGVVWSVTPSGPFADASLGAAQEVSALGETEPDLSAVAASPSSPSQSRTTAPAPTPTQPDESGSAAAQADPRPLSSRTSTPATSPSTTATSSAVPRLRTPPTSAPPEPLTGPKPVELTRLPVDWEEDVTSYGDDPSTYIKFTNRSSMPVKVFFLNPEGHQLYSDLEPGDDFVQQTWTDHAWMVTDANEQGLFIVVAVPEAGAVTID